MLLLPRGQAALLSLLLPYFLPFVGFRIACPMARERQLTNQPYGHILTNTQVWSPDSRRIVYDIRSDPAGDVFDGTRIESVDAQTGTVRVLYESRNGACCGVATYSPVANKVVFILGPEHPTPDWQYGPTHRQGVIVAEDNPGQVIPLDARDLVPPFTPGALRGGTHVHVFSGDGQWVSFTYEDHVLAQFGEELPGQETNLRNVGVSIPGREVRVPTRHPRNHDGSHFSVVVTRTTAHPRPGSDEISKAFEDAWVGIRGYQRPDGSHQERALAFQGHVRDARNQVVSEVFIVDLPQDPTEADDLPLEGTPTRRPAPPRGTVQRRLTYTTERKYPGIQGPRHWLRSSPDGQRIAFLLRDEQGIVQIASVSPAGGPISQITHNPWSIASAFTWSPDGRYLAHVMDNSVCLTHVATGITRRLTARTEDAWAPRPEACVFAPDGKRIAYVRPVAREGKVYNQVFVCELADEDLCKATGESSTEPNATSTR